MPERYYEIEIRIDPSGYDVLVGFLSDWDVEGFLENDHSLNCYVKEQCWNEEQERRLRQFLSTLKAEGTVSQADLRISQVETRDWNAEWEHTVLPMAVTDRIVVRPSWHVDKPEWYDKPRQGLDKSGGGRDKLVLVVDPKMAFGTGYHESTRIALRLLEQCIRQRDSVLDVGTGTGILAVAAAKLGASKVVAIDNDPWAYTNAVETVQRNRVSDKVAIRLLGLDALPPGRYDLVVVNIAKNAILESTSLLAAKLGHGGRLILSGLIQSDAPEVLEDLRSHRFEILQSMAENEWVGIAAMKQ
ncbi:MAG: 50S ribosomal protein L11 methyltransferase [Bacteroidota bacterium]